jgi:ABC-type nitrate/sulfonate/bicarbonate transport system substrate-binding protein
MDRGFSFKGLHPSSRQAGGRSWAARGRARPVIVLRAVDRERASRSPRRARLSLAATLATALLACAPRPRERLVIALPRQPSNALLFLAIDAGFVREEGVDLVVEDFITGKDALTAALAGRADLATAYETPVVFEAFKGAPLRVLTMLHTSTRSSALVARADRGIRSSGDLAGRHIGVTRGTNAEFFLRTLLAFSGLGWEDVDVVDVPVAGYSAALSSGRVDALATWSPYVERLARELGAERAIVFHSDVYAEASMLLAPASVLAARRPALSALLRALARAERAARETPERSFEAVRKRLADADPEEVRKSWEHIMPRLGVSNALVALLHSEGEWLASEGHPGAAVPEFRLLLAPELLDEIDPEAVTLEGPP